jgi:uncharacterized protein YbgA (DUF1722 family)
MRSYARRRAAELAKADLCGYILKKDSPSCGMAGVRVHHDGGRVSRSGRGLFAEALLEKLPNLPLEEEGRLRDPRLRDNWIERVFAYRRLQDLWAGRWRIGDLAEFHAAHELTLLAHSPKAHAELERLVAEAKALPRPELRERYEHGFMAALAKLATPIRHASVLRRVAKQLGNRLDPAEWDELRSLIDDYRRGLLSLITPFTIVAHHVRQYGTKELRDQAYFSPHPKELPLRYHV